MTHSLNISLSLTHTHTHTHTHSFTHRCDPLHPQELDHQEDQGTVREENTTPTIHHVPHLLHYDRPLSSTYLYHDVFISLVAQD